MYGVPQAGLTVPAVAGQLERGVRPHRCDLWEHDQLLLEAGLMRTAIALLGMCCAKRLVVHLADTHVWDVPAYSNSACSFASSRVSCQVSDWLFQSSLQPNK